MFWNRKKRKQDEARKEAEAIESLRQDFLELQGKQEDRKKRKDISEPIKAFLAASERWEVWSGARMGLDVIIVTDPETSLRLDMFLDIGHMGNILSVCLNHSWLSSDEKSAVVEEIGRVKMARQSAIEGRERQKWTEAYKNLGEVV